MSDSFPFDHADPTLLLNNIASALSHDVRTPLRHTTQFLEFYERELAAGNIEKAAGYLAVVKESVAQSYAMIDGLIGYARAGRDLDPPENEDLRKLTQTAIDRVRLATQVESIDYAFKGEATVHGHHIQLLELFYQIFENSVLFGRPDIEPKIRVRSRKAEQGVVITIRDNGPGLPESHHKMIFDLFHKISHSNNPGGLGVGLSLARRIAELHGGSLRVAEPNDDATDRGLALELILPAAIERES